MDAELVVYVVVVLKVLRKPYVKRDKNYKQCLRIATVRIFSFLLYYKKCVKIFSNIEAGKLLLFKEGDYVLDLVDSKKPPYSPFYNLL